MCRSGISNQLFPTLAVGALFAGVASQVAAQTTPTTPPAATKPAQTPAQRAAAAQLAAQQAAQRAAIAKREADIAAAKANAASARAARTATPPASTAAAATVSPAAASVQAAAPATPVATPAAPPPSRLGWFQQQMAAPAASGTQASTGGKAGNSFTSGFGSMTYSDITVVSYGCLRQGPRVFCDYDQFKRNIGQANANWGAVMVLSGGRTVNQQRATYIDADGTPFPTAQLNPTTGVRMMVEYDDVPLTQSRVDLVLGQQRVNVPINDMPESGPPSRSAVSSAQGAPAGQQPGSPASTGQTLAGAQGKVTQAQSTATGAAQGASGAVSGASQGVKSVSDSFRNIFKKPQQP